VNVRAIFEKIYWNTGTCTGQLKGGGDFTGEGGGREDLKIGGGARGKNFLVLKIGE